MHAFSVMAVSFLMFLAGCGGGGSSPPAPTPQTAEGRFIDTVVEGLGYSSGDQSGFTSDSGTFTYEEGSNITFSVGAVEIGSVTGDSIITPVNLTGSNSTMSDTQSIVRFLLMLDTDNDSSNGITISNEVQVMAENWSQVDFTSTDFEANLASIISDVAGVDNRTPVLPSAQEAQNHLESTLACLSSGVFKGSFSGQDNGTFLLWIQHERFDPLVFGDNTPRTGVTSAIAYSTDEDIILGVAPQQGLSYDSDNQFISGLVSSGAEFIGDLENYNNLTNGSWNNGLTSESGTFTGERINMNPDAQYRLSGFFNRDGFDFTPDGSGVIALNIFEDNSITGTLVTLRGDETVLSGTLNGTDLAISGGDFTFDLTFDADGTDASNDLVLGTASGFIGTMSNTSGNFGVIGTSCQPD